MKKQPKAISDFYSKLGKKSAAARRKKILELTKKVEEIRKHGQIDGNIHAERGLEREAKE